MKSHKLTNVTNPTNAQDVATKGYVDGAKYARSVITLTTTTTLDAAANTDYVVFIGSGGVPTLPTAIGSTNKYTLKNIDSSSKTITTSLSQTIDGGASATLTPNSSIDVLSDGTNWRII